MQYIDSIKRGTATRTKHERKRKKERKKKRKKERKEEKKEKKVKKEKKKEERKKLYLAQDRSMRFAFSFGRKILTCPSLQWNAFKPSKQACP